MRPAESDTMRQLYLDVETTGLHADQGDRIIEIGIIAYPDENRRASEVQEYHQLVNPGRSIPADAVKIHGITDEQVVGQPDFAAVAADFLAFVQGAVVHAHNAPFDCGFLDAELRRAGHPPLSEAVAEIVDTLQLAQRLYAGGHNSLDALARRADINLSTRRERHGALIDAKLLADVHVFLTQRQSSLDLAAAIDDDASLPQPDQIKQHAFAPSAAAATRHAEFLDEIEQAAGVKFLLRDDQRE